MPILLLEGGNATGKSTLQANLLREFTDYQACYALDPSFSPLRGNAYNQWSDPASFYFYLAGNLQTFAHLDASHKVLLDRSPLSTFAMYMARLDENQWPSLLPLFELTLSQLPQIAGVIHLTADKPTRLARISLKSGQAQAEDLKEIEFEDKKQRAREYLLQHSHAHICHIDTSTLSADEVAAKARAFVSSLALPQLTLLLGLPASGKSTYCQPFADEGQCVILSTDDLREQRHGSAFNAVIRAEVFGRLQQQITLALKQGRSVMVDSTYFNRQADRHALFAHLTQVQVAYTLQQKNFEVDLETCVRRDSLREAHRCVGRAVIEKLAAEFEPATELISAA